MLFFISLLLFYPINCLVMKANFNLSEKLRLYLQVATSYRVLTLGDKYPVSIRRRYSMSQSIVIYPDADYNFFMQHEVMSFLSLANNLNLQSSISVENGMPIIEITDWSINDK